MSRSERANFINISFMMCFKSRLDQNIRLKILYLPTWICYSIVFIKDIIES